MTWTLTIYMIACKAIDTLVIIKPMSRAYLKNALTLLSTDLTGLGVCIKVCLNF